MSEPVSLIRRRQLRQIAEIQRRLDEGETVLLYDENGSRVWLDGRLRAAHELFASLRALDGEESSA